MLVLALVHIIISVVCLWTGYLFYRVIRVDSRERPFIFFLVSGLIVVTAITQLVALFMPVGGLMTWVLLVMPLITAVMRWHECLAFFVTVKRQLLSMPSTAIILAMATWLMILLINAGPVMMDDTESYHIQMVKWLREYGTVPGIANLHERYGFNSSWFSSIAGFNFFSQFDMYTVLNGVASGWLSLYIIYRIGSHPLPFLFVLVISLFAWPLLRGNAATANYDFITTVIVFILFVEYFIKRDDSPFTIHHSPEWILWPMYLFTVRITNFPYLLLTLFALYFLLKGKNKKWLWISISTVVLLIIPFLARNYILSGYAFYPSHFLSVYHADWKVDPVITERLLEYIKYYNRVNTTFAEIEATKQLGAVGWIPSWFRHLFIHDKILLVTGIAGLVLGARMRRYHLMMVTFLVAIISWFLVAPDPRFIYGILLSGCFLLIYHLQSYLKLKVSPKLLKYALLVTTAIILLYTVRKARDDNRYRNWISIYPLPKPGFQKIQMNNGIYHVPDLYNDNWNRRCYDIDLPCLYQVDPRLEMRGDSISDGYRLKK